MNFKKVLIAIDDGPTAEQVVLAGTQLALQLNAEIALLSVADTAFLMTDGNVTPIEMAEIIKKDLKKNQNRLIEKILKGNKVWPFVEEGKPHETILKVADEWRADLIILGTHGRTGISHLVMGSVAEKVIRHANKPVFIVPTK